MADSREPGVTARLPKPGDVVDGRLMLDVVPCRESRPLCGPDKKFRGGSWTACWGCLGDGTHAGKPRDPDAEWDQVTPVPKRKPRKTARPSRT